MLRSTGPNISIITNFGCGSNCWYCIWKGHSLEKINERTDWSKLENFLLQHNERVGKVSVSGGGDPLYRYEENVGWWDRLFGITAKLGMLVDIHTREKLLDESFWKEKINRCVFSSDAIDNDTEYLRWLSGLTKVRITHLATVNTSLNLIDKYLTFQDEIKCQFTVKKLVGHDDHGTYDELKKKYPEIFFLDACDYNIYYMPDNSLRSKFLF